MNGLRFRKRVFCLLVLLIQLLTLLPAQAASSFKWKKIPDLVRPGKNVRLELSARGSGIRVEILDAAGQTAALLLENGEADGILGLNWDGDDLPEGSYTLVATKGKTKAKKKLRVGPEAPRLLETEYDDMLDGNWQVTVGTNMAGILSLCLTEDGKETEVASVRAEAGENFLAWDGRVNGEALTDGDYELILRLLDQTGFSSNPEGMTVTVEGNPAPMPAGDMQILQPSSESPYPCDHDDTCYWRMNLGETDDEAVWRVLTAPITVLDGEQRQQIAVRARPEEDCRDHTGVVTCASQGVHVLERGDEWSLIEAYSSAEEGSEIPVFATLFQGYVRTSLLREKQVDQTYGLVVDKLQQRLYVYKEGKKYATLLCSTGYAREETPFHETPAGEFIIVSWTGGFWSGDLYCNYGLRINSGILLHEVPCKQTGDDQNQWDYSRCERYLGEKASHGCIRIQRAMTPEYVNMKWLWDNLSRDPCTKVLVWDDAGRVLGYPDDDLKLYYNPKGGKYYHSSPRCADVKEKYWPLTPFTYGQLDEKPFSKLTACPSCAPQLRKDGIDTLNRKNKR